MVERKEIEEEDVAIIKGMDEKQESLTKLHSKIRKDFLRAEAVILREQGSLEREFKTFILGVAKSMELDENEIKNWKLDLELGAFIKEVAEPEIPKEILLAEEEPEVILSQEEKALQAIRQKYKR